MSRGTVLLAASMLTVSIQSAAPRKERPKMSGAMFSCQGEAWAVHCDSCTFSARFRRSVLLARNCRWHLGLRPAARKRFLLLIWLLTSCFRSGDLPVTRMKVSARMKGSADCRPLGCQVVRFILLFGDSGCALCCTGVSFFHCISKVTNNRPSNCVFGIFFLTSYDWRCVFILEKLSF